MQIVSVSTVVKAVKANTPVRADMLDKGVLRPICWTRACSGVFIGAKTKGPKVESGGGVLGRGQQPHQLVGLGKRYELQHQGSGRSADRPKVFHYFQLSDGLS